MWQSNRQPTMPCRGGPLRRGAAAPNWSRRSSVPRPRSSRCPNGTLVLPLRCRMWRHAPVYSAMLALLCWGFAGGWYAGEQLQATLSARLAPYPDGAPASTFWTQIYVDAPGVEVADLHCRGTVRLIVQFGETGPDTSCE